jgi:hypothetical protein
MARKLRLGNKQLKSFREAGLNLRRVPSTRFVLSFANRVQMMGQTAGRTIQPLISAGENRGATGICGGNETRV